MGPDAARLSPPHSVPTAAARTAPPQASGPKTYRQRRRSRFIDVATKEQEHALASALAPEGSLPSHSRSHPALSSPDFPSCEAFHDLRSPVEVPTRVRQALEIGEEAAPGSVELALDPELVCSFSCHGIEPGCDGTGQHKINQDCACICYPFCQDPQCALFCVLDGHGRQGASVSSAAMDHLIEDIEKRLMDDEAIVDALTHAFEVPRQPRTSSPWSSGQAHTSEVPACRRPGPHVSFLSTSQCCLFDSTHRRRAALITAPFPQCTRRPVTTSISNQKTCAVCVRRGQISI